MQTVFSLRKGFFLRSNSEGWMSKSAGWLSPTNGETICWWVSCCILSSKMWFHWSVFTPSFCMSQNYQTCVAQNFVFFEKSKSHFLLQYFGFSSCILFGPHFSGLSHHYRLGARNPVCANGLAIGSVILFKVSNDENLKNIQILIINIILYIVHNIIYIIYYNVYKYYIL